jgi:hypothetical protein
MVIELFYHIVPNNYAIKNKDIQEKYDATKILILGNSHTFYGLNPKFFDLPTYNLSNISQTLYFDALLLDKHIKKFKKLEYVVLNVDYSSLSQLDNSDEDTWRKYYYKNYMDLDVPIISTFDPKGYFLSSTRSFNINVKLIKRFFEEGSIVDCDQNGFGSNYNKEKRLLNIQEITPYTIKRHEDGLYDFTNNINRVQLIINRCKIYDVKVLILIMPASRPYAKGINPIKLNKIFKSCLSIRNRNSNVIYLNLFNDGYFNDDDFYDPDHLHSDGAKKCSIFVNNFLNTIK